jgi:uncharacterized protein (DUF924 family)
MMGRIGAECYPSTMTRPSLEPADVLDFWFRERPADAEAAMPQLRRWFQGGPEVDREIVARFAPAVAAVLDGDFTSWEAEPRGRLALIILLDQLARSVHRDDPRSFAGDARAQRLAAEMLDRGLDRGLPFWERLFVDMPLRHAEDAALQRRALEAARRLMAEAPPALAPVAAMAVEQSEKYLAIVERFGRFPHRNRLLGRRSRPEEEAFLVDWLEKAPPRAMA